MSIEQASIEDAAEILRLQRLAYQSEAATYSDYSIPPLTQSLEELEAQFDNHIILKVSLEDGIIGSVRAHVKRGTCFIGRLVVHPDFQHQGVGTSLMHAIERRFGDARRFELFTGHLSQRSLCLYQKLGYQTSRRERVHKNLELVYLEKATEST